MKRKATRAAWLLPLAVLLALFTLRGAAGCRRKPSAGTLEVTPASKRPWITPLLTAPPAQPTPTLWRSDITRIPTLPE